MRVSETCSPLELGRDGEQSMGAPQSASGFDALTGFFPTAEEPADGDRDRMMTHPQFRVKLEAAGFGIFVPVFFVTSGLRFDLDARFASGSTIALVPILAALLIVRGQPALVYRSTIGDRQTVVAELLQATSLPFIVAASMIGIELGLLDEATSAALIAAGLFSVLIFPLVALTILRGMQPSRAQATVQSWPRVGARRTTS
jgi:Sodium/hydrogen exchanger family